MSSEHWSPKNQPGPPPYGGRGVQPAEWWERFVARLIDGVLFGITTMIVSAILFAVLVPLFAFAAYGGFAGTVFFLAYLACWVVSGLLYGAYDYFLHARTGQTLGKMALRIRLATIDGRPLSRQVLLRRSAAYPGVFALVGLLAGLSWSAAPLGTLLVVGLSLADGIPIITDQRLHQALHDRFAGTVVIKAA